MFCILPLDQTLLGHQQSPHRARISSLICKMDSQQLDAVVKIEPSKREQGYKISRNVLQK